MAAPVTSAPPSWVSLRAVIWVLEEADNVPSQLVSLLIGFARHSDDNGMNSYPGHATLVTYTRKTARQVKKDIAQALELGLIRKPVDQSAARHIRADRRPTVYDLAFAPLRAYEGNSTTPREADKPVNGVSQTTRRGRHPAATGGTGRRVVEGHTGCPPGSHGVSCTTPEEDRTNQEHRDGGTLPPCPPATQAGASADLDRSHDPLTAVPDYNDTKKVTSRTRAPAETNNRPLLAIIEDTDRETIWNEIQPTIDTVTTRPGATA